MNIFLWLRESGSGMNQGTRMSIQTNKTLPSLKNKLTKLLRRHCNHLWQEM